MRHPFRLSFLLSLMILTACQSQVATESEIEIPYQDSSDYSEHVVKPRDFQINMQLNGTTINSFVVGIEIPKDAVFKPTIELGSRVKRGQVIGSYRPDPSSLKAQMEKDPGSIKDSKLDFLYKHQGDVSAPVSGVLLSKGDYYFVKQSGLAAVVSLTPLQHLRVESSKYSGLVNVETLFGTETAECESLWNEISESNTEALLYCRIPQEIETVPGLPVVLKISSDEVKNVIAVPAKFIAVTEDRLNYAVRVKDGNTSRLQVVKVGATDGVVRIVTAGLKGNETLLSFDEAP
ncbi:MAG: hypothetical protein RL038_686 [Actinomycetota bacterium]